MNIFLTFLMFTRSTFKKYKNKYIPNRRGIFSSLTGLYTINKAPIFIIILAFLFNLLLPLDFMAWAKKTDTMPSPIGKEPSVDPGQPVLLTPNDITIPNLYGSIKEKYQQDTNSKGLIVHIQDLHTNYQAHKNIASIITHLVNKYDISLILSEAKSTDRGFAYLRPWTRKEVRDKVAEDNLKKGTMTGWEALDLTSNLDLVLQGIEDKNLYMKDMESFIKADAIRPDALKFLSVLKNIIENLKLHMYTEVQKTFDKKMRFFMEEKIGIKEYTEYLFRLAKKYRLYCEEFKNLKILLQTVNLEEKINFKKAESERESLMDTLTRGLKDDELKVLLDMLLKFKSGRVSQYSFYQYVLSLAERFGIDMKKYPEFNLFTTYLVSYHMLDSSKLFEEIKALEDKLATVMFTGRNQNRLFQVSKDFIILKGLVDFKLTPDEFDYYLASKTRFDIEDWLGFLRINSEYFKLTQYVPQDATVITENLSTFEDFYKIAHLRDKAFVDNIDKEFKKRNVQSAVLMTGGFHTPGVTRLLKERGYSYVVISPRIEEEMDYDKYHRILKESYIRLRESAAISPWSITEIPNNILNRIARYGGIRFATPQERFMFEVRGAGAIITSGQEGILSRALLPFAIENPSEFEKFLRAIETLRKDKGAVGQEEFTRILATTSMAGGAIPARVEVENARRAVLESVLERLQTLEPAELGETVRKMLRQEVPELPIEMATARREALEEVIELPEGLSREEILNRIREMIERGPRGRRNITPRFTSAEGIEATVVIVREGVVETSPVSFVEGKPVILEEFSVRVAPGQEAVVRPKRERPTRVSAPPLTNEVFDIVRPIIPTKKVASVLEESRREVIEHRGNIIKELGERMTRIVIDVDALTETLEPEARREVFIDYFTLLAESMSMWRIYAGSNVYFDFVGENEDLVNEIKGIYYGLPVVMANQNVMKLWSEADISPEEREGARAVSISYINSKMFFENPTFYVRNRIFQRNKLNFVDWDRAILSSLRTALGIDRYEEFKERPEGFVSEIERALSERGTNFANLRENLILLFHVEDKARINAALISRFYTVVPRNEQERENYKNEIGLYIEPIEPINFEEMRELHNMLREVQLSI